MNNLYKIVVRDAIISSRFIEYMVFAESAKTAALKIKLKNKHGDIVELYEVCKIEDDVFLYTNLVLIDPFYYM